MCMARNVTYRFHQQLLNYGLALLHIFRRIDVDFQLHGLEDGKKLSGLNAVLLFDFNLPDLRSSVSDFLRTHSRNEDLRLHRLELLRR